MPSRQTTPTPAPPSPNPPPLPRRPPLRSRRKSKSPSSRSTHSTAKRALDVDQIGPDAGNRGRTRKGSRDLQRSRDSGLDAKWEDVTSELRHRGGRTRSTVYQTSDLPSMVKAKRQAEQSGGPGQTGRSKVKATFV